MNLAKIRYSPVFRQLTLPMAATDALDEQLTANFYCFDAYRASRLAAKRPASVVTLKKERLQWNSMCRHFQDERVAVDDVTETTFTVFFVHPLRKDNHIRNKVSYLRLFENVMKANAEAAARLPAGAVTHLTWNRVASKMLEHESYRYADGVGNKRQRIFLTEADDRKLRDYLYVIPKEGSVILLRTFVYMAVLRGSGATPGEIRTLLTEEIDFDSAERAVRVRMYGRGGSPG
jgi:hypothetical protein